MPIVDLTTLDNLTVLPRDNQSHQPFPEQIKSDRPPASHLDPFRHQSQISLFYNTLFLSKSQILESKIFLM